MLILGMIASSPYPELKKIFEDNNFDLEYFERNRESVLDDLESRLSISRLTGTNIRRLEHAVEEIKKSNDPIILTNLVSRGEESLIIYTDDNVSKLFGLI